MLMIRQAWKSRWLAGPNITMGLFISRLVVTQHFAAAAAAAAVMLRQAQPLAPQALDYGWQTN